MQTKLSMPESSNNKRIAKNTIMLYIRMLISMLVGMYTSRVVLQTLGVEDYGVFGVVGGVVSMMGFLNSSMSGATSRFITFELGRGDLQRVRDTFSSAVIIHVGIALFVIFFAETIGLWFLCNKLVIPEGRMVAAHWVYQCSIISAAVGITQTPYTAVIMSHEKMDIYAYMELLNVCLKLCIVYMLVIGNFDKLILYSLLSLVVSIIIAFLYRVYCIKHYTESHFKWIYDKEILKPMMNFSGWDLYGHATVAIRQQGVNFLINMFHGIVYNAASGIASMFNGVVTGLACNIGLAFNPSIIKEYAAGNPKKSVELILNGAKIMSLLMITMTIIFYYEINLIMEFWLVEVPAYATDFCKLMMINGCVFPISNILSTGIQASGKIRLASVIVGTIEILSLPILWLFYYGGSDVCVAYYLSIAVSSMSLLSRSIIMSKFIQCFKVWYLIRDVLIPLSIVAFVVFWSASILTSFMDDGILRLLILPLFVVSLVLVLCICFLLKRTERDNLYLLIKKWLHII